MEVRGGRRRTEYIVIDWRAVRMLCYWVTVSLSLLSAYLLVRVRQALARIFGAFLVTFAVTNAVWGLMLALGVGRTGIWSIVTTATVFAQVAVSLLLVMVLTGHERGNGGLDNN